MLRIVKNKVNTEALGLNNPITVSMPSAIWEEYTNPEEPSEANFVQNADLTAWYQNHSTVTIEDYSSSGYFYFDIELPNGLTVPCVYSEEDDMGEPTPKYIGTVTISDSNFNGSDVIRNEAYGATPIPNGQTFYTGLYLSIFTLKDFREEEIYHDLACTAYYKVGNVNGNGQTFYPTTLEALEAGLENTNYYPRITPSDIFPFSINTIGLVFKISVANGVGTIQEVYMNKTASYTPANSGGDEQGSSSSGSAHFSGSEFGSGWD